MFLGVMRAARNSPQSAKRRNPRIWWASLRREELCWQNLWKVFYRTIAVEGRRNPKLRQNLCPKRFWPLMTELEGELG